MAYIEKVFSNIENNEHLYSVIMTEEEYRLFSLSFAGHGKIGRFLRGLTSSGRALNRLSASRLGNINTATYNSRVKEATKGLRGKKRTEAANAVDRNVHVFRKPDKGPLLSIKRRGNFGFSIGGRIKDGISESGSKIKDGISESGSKIKDRISESGSKIKDGISESGSKIKDRITGLFKRAPKEEASKITEKHLAYGAAAAGGVLGIGDIISAANSKKSK